MQKKTESLDPEQDASVVAERIRLEDLEASERELSVKWREERDLVEIVEGNVAEAETNEVLGKGKPSADLRTQLKDATTRRDGTLRKLEAVRRAVMKQLGNLAAVRAVAVERASEQLLITYQQLGQEFIDALVAAAEVAHRMANHAASLSGAGIPHHPDFSFLWATRDLAGRTVISGAQIETRLSLLLESAKKLGYQTPSPDDPRFRPPPDIPAITPNPPAADRALVAVNQDRRAKRPLVDALLDYSERLLAGR